MPQSNVFPTRVGMNRLHCGAIDIWTCVPHARGDEPECSTCTTALRSVFPTRVGMNRHRRRIARHRACSPRAWG